MRADDDRTTTGPPRTVAPSERHRDRGQERRQRQPDLERRPREHERRRLVAPQRVGDEAAALDEVARDADVVGRVLGLREDDLARRTTIRTTSATTKIPSAVRTGLAAGHGRWRSDRVDGAGRRRRCPRPGSAGRARPGRSVPSRIGATAATARRGRGRASGCRRRGDLVDRVERVVDQDDAAVAGPVARARRVDRHDPVASAARRRRRAPRRRPGSSSRRRVPVGVDDERRRATAMTTAKAIAPPPKTRSAPRRVPARPSRGDPGDGEDDPLERQDVAVRRQRDRRVDERPARDVDRRDQRGEGEQERGVDEERPEVGRAPARPAADDHAAGRGRSRTTSVDEDHRRRDQRRRSGSRCSGPIPIPSRWSSVAGVVMLFHSPMSRMNRTLPDAVDGESEPKTASWRAHHGRHDQDEDRDGADRRSERDRRGRRGRRADAPRAPAIPGERRAPSAASTSSAVVARQRRQPGEQPGRDERAARAAQARARPSTATPMTSGW